MKTRLKQFFIVLLGTAIVAGCDTSISKNNQDPSSGTADFSTFVAIGDSLTAGYADGALYRQIQESSLPSIMAQQFRRAGGGAFTQPLMPMHATGSLTWGMLDLGRPDRLMAVSTGNPDSPVAPAPIVPAISSDIVAEGAPGLYNNIGVPGAKIFHAPVGGYGNPMGLPAAANPYFVRFASGLGASMLGDAIAQAPSFFMIWLGSNDILLYAADGADPTVNMESVTPLANMTAAFDVILPALKTANNKGLIINIPDVTSIPYFNTVPYNAIPLDEAQAQALNLTLAATNNAVVNGAGLGPTETAQRQLSYSAGMNPVLIVDELLTPLAPLGPLAQARPATPEDFILLPAAPMIGEVEPTATAPFDTWGVSLPLRDRDVLTEREVTLEIEAVRVPFNEYIEGQAAGDPDLVFYDAAARLIELNENGISYGSGGVTSAFIQGGFFSLDGIHPTARGYAVIANEVFSIINDNFDAFIPPVDPNQYTTIHFQ